MDKVPDDRGNETSAMAFGMKGEKPATYASSTASYNVREWMLGVFSAVVPLGIYALPSCRGDLLMHVLGCEDAARCVRCREALREAGTRAVASRERSPMVLATALAGSG